MSFIFVNNLIDPLENYEDQISLLSK